MTWGQRFYKYVLIPVAFVAVLVIGVVQQHAADDARSRSHHEAVALCKGSVQSRQDIKDSLKALFDQAVVAQTDPARIASTRAFETEYLKGINKKLKGSPICDLAGIKPPPIR